MRHALAIVLVALAAAGPVSAATSLDSSQLVIPSATSAAQSLTAARGFQFHLAMSRGAIGPTLGSGENLQLVDVLVGREISESASWHHEFDPHNGSVLLLRREGVAVPRGPTLSPAAAETKIRADVLQRLGALGISSTEAQAARVRPLMKSTRSLGSSSGTSTVVAYKAFVSRALAGVALPESRLVFTYGTDGSLWKMYGRWPELASDGHTLTTSLTSDQIKVEVAAGVESRIAGRTLSGAVPLRLVYVEDPVGDGSVRLRLRAEATIVPTEAPGRFAQASAEVFTLSR